MATERRSMGTVLLKYISTVCCRRSILSILEYMCVDTGMRFHIDAEALINAQARIRNTYRKCDRVQSAARGDGSSAAGENEEEHANGLRNSSADKALHILSVGHLAKYTKMKMRMTGLY